MKGFKIITIMILFMCIFSLLIVPIEEGLFPSWLNTDLIQFLLIILSAVCVIAIILSR